MKNLFKRNKTAGTPGDAEEQQAEAAAEDPNACPDCDGGLVGDPAGANKICESCKGSGVKQTTSYVPEGKYKPGTQVLTQNGNYIADENGDLQKQE